MDILVPSNPPDPTPETQTEELHKAVDWPPKGGGWEAIPKKRGGRMGMRRRKADGSYEYAYQPQMTQAKPRQARPVLAAEAVHPAQAPSPPARQPSLFDLPPATMQRIVKDEPKQGPSATLAALATQGVKVKPESVLTAETVKIGKTVVRPPSMLLAFDDPPPRTFDKDPKHQPDQPEQAARNKRAATAARATERVPLVVEDVPELTPDDILAEVEAHLDGSSSGAGLADLLRAVSTKELGAWVDRYTAGVKELFGDDPATVKIWLAAVKKAEALGRGRRALDVVVAHRGGEKVPAPKITRGALKLKPRVPRVTDPTLATKEPRNPLGTGELSEKALDVLQRTQASGHGWTGDVPEVVGELAAQGLVHVDVEGKVARITEAGKTWLAARRAVLVAKAEIDWKAKHPDRPFPAELHAATLELAEVAAGLKQARTPELVARHAALLKTIEAQEEEHGFKPTTAQGLRAYFGLTDAWRIPEREGEKLARTLLLGTDYRVRLGIDAEGDAKGALDWWSPAAGAWQTVQRGPVEALIGTLAARSPGKKLRVTDTGEVPAAAKLPEGVPATAAQSTAEVVRNAQALLAQLKPVGDSKAAKAWTRGVAWAVELAGTIVAPPGYMSGEKITEAERALYHLRDLTAQKKAASMDRDPYWRGAHAAAAALVGTLPKLRARSAEDAPLVEDTADAVKILPPDFPPEIDAELITRTIKERKPLDDGPPRVRKLRNMPPDGWEPKGLDEETIARTLDQLRKALKTKEGKERAQEITEYLRRGDEELTRLRRQGASDEPGVAVQGGRDYARSWADVVSEVGDYGVRPGWGPATRLQRNEEARQLAARLAKEGKAPQGAERDVLAGYSGHGGTTGEASFGLLNEFYSPAKLASAMWHALHNGGWLPDKAEILEPTCGTGVFLEHAPKGVRGVGVELDSDSARVAHLLHGVSAMPGERAPCEVVKSPLEVFAVKDCRLFDAAIGNPPFGARGRTLGADPEKKDLSAHEYGLDTALDKTRDGGVVAMIVPSSVMTGADGEAFRERLCKKAELIHAWRLPTSTFRQAGAEVTTDVIYLRKRPQAVASAARLLKGEELTRAGLLDETWTSGRYFEAHPEHVLGTIGVGYGSREQIDGTLGPEQLARIATETPTAAQVSGRSKQIGIADLITLFPDRADELALASDSRPYRDPIGAVKLIDGVRHVLRELAPGVLRWRSVEDAEELAALELTDKEAIDQAREIGQGVVTLQKAIRDGDDPRQADALRLEIRRKLVAWTEKHGRPALHKRVGEHLAEPRVAWAFQATVRPDGTLCDLLEQQIVPPAKDLPPETATEVGEAAANVARINNGIIDPRSVAAQLGREDVDAVLGELLRAPGVYVDDDGRLVDKAAFLSGYLIEKAVNLEHVRKLVDTAAQAPAELRTRIAQARAQAFTAIGNPDAARLAAAQGVIGVDLRETLKRRDQLLRSDMLAEHASAIKAKLDEGLALLTENRSPVVFDDIDVAVRSGWVPHDILAGYFDSRVSSALSLRFTGTTYQVIYNGHVVGSEEAGKSADWKAVEDLEGGDWAHAFVNHLNRQVRGEKQKSYVVEIDHEYKAWLGGQPEARETIEDTYNRTFHSYAPRAASQEAVPLHDWNYGEWPGRTPHGYQYQAARWALDTGRGILGDDVGLGKTTEILAMISALQAQGKGKKPVIVVPKALLGNWQDELRAMRPGARVVVIGEKYEQKGDKTIAKEQSKEERAKAWQDAAVNRYDVILCSRESFELLRLSPEKQGQLYDAEWEVRAAVDKSKGDADKKRAKFLADVQAEDSKKAELGAPGLDEIGIDAMFVDEGHGYKNLYTPKQRNGATVKYLGSGGKAARARDMKWKTQAVRDQNGGRGVWFATATPVKNSPLEVYAMMTHVAPEVWLDRGIRNAEEFIDRYCQIETKQVLGNDARGTMAPCVVGFKNVRELRTIVGQYMLVRDARQVQLQIPRDEQIGHTLEGTENQQKTMDALRERLDMLRKKAEKGEAGGEGEVEVDEDEEDAEKKGAKKTEATIADVMRTVASTDGVEDDHIFKILHAMQAVSIDPALARNVMADPSGDMRSPKLEALAKNCADVIREGKAQGKDCGQVVFCDLANSSHERIKAELIAAGVPADEIGIINRTVCKTASEQHVVAKAFQAGKLRVVIGNTACMGEGVNLQNTATDMHHVDVPWDPGSLQQRIGRAIRQGNRKEKVENHFYLMSGTNDSYRTQNMVGKGSWLKHLWHGTSDEVEIPTESQGFDIEQIYVLGHRDPEQAQRELAEAKRADEERNADKAMLKSMARYHALRRSWAELKALKDRAARAKLDPTVKPVDPAKLKNKEAAIEAAKRTLRNDPYFPWKDALDNLEGGRVVESTGLVVQAGMSLKIKPGPGDRVPRYFHVTSVDADGSVQGVEFGAITGNEGLLTKLGNKQLDRAVPTQHGPENALLVLASQCEYSPEAALKSIPVDARTGIAEAIRAGVGRYLNGGAVNASYTWPCWKLDDHGEPALLLRTADTIQKAGKGELMLFVGDDEDRKKVGEYIARLRQRAETGSPLGLGLGSWESPRSAVRDVLDKATQLCGGSTSTLAETWADRATARRAHEFETADALITHNRAWSHHTPTAYDESNWKNEWSNGQISSTVRGEIDWPTALRRQPEAAKRALVSGLMRGESWTTRPDVAESGEAAALKAQLGRAVEVKRDLASRNLLRREAQQLCKVFAWIPGAAEGSRDRVQVAGAGAEDGLSFQPSYGDSPSAQLDLRGDVLDRLPGLGRLPEVGYKPVHVGYGKTALVGREISLVDVEIEGLAEAQEKERQLNLADKKARDEEQVRRQEAVDKAQRQRAERVAWAKTQAKEIGLQPGDAELFSTVAEGRTPPPLHYEEKSYKDKAGRTQSFVKLYWGRSGQGGYRSPGGAEGALAKRLSDAGWEWNYKWSNWGGPRSMTPAEAKGFAVGIETAYQAQIARVQKAKEAGLFAGDAWRELNIPEWNDACKG